MDRGFTEVCTGNSKFKSMKNNALKITCHTEWSEVSDFNQAYIRCFVPQHDKSKMDVMTTLIGLSSDVNYPEGK